MRYNGNCELHKAIQSNNVEGLRTLIEKEMDVNVVCWIGSYDYTPLMIAADIGSIESVCLLVQHGASVNAVNFNGCPALGFALCSGHIQVAELLVQSGADVNVRTVENDMPLLIGVASTGPPASVQFLIDRGVEVNAQDSKGNTALSWALKHSPDVAELLIQAGAYQTSSTLPTRSVPPEA